MRDKLSLFSTYIHFPRIFENFLPCYDSVVINYIFTLLVKNATSLSLNLLLYTDIWFCLSLLVMHIIYIVVLFSCIIDWYASIMFIKVLMIKICFWENSVFHSYVLCLP